MRHGGADCPQYILDKLEHVASSGLETAALLGPSGRAERLEAVRRSPTR